MVTAARQPSPNGSDGTARHVEVSVPLQLNCRGYFLGERRGVSPPVEWFTGGLTPRRSPAATPSRCALQVINFVMDQAAPDFR